MLSWLVNLLLGEQFVRWLGRFAEDGTSNNPSTKRFAALLATSVYTLLALFLGYRLGYIDEEHATLYAFITVCICLMTLAGFAYLLGKAIERMPGKQPDRKDNQPGE